ncbi:MAG: type II toxin-antitoxin system death-on-curing family toxin [bacterium]
MVRIVYIRLDRAIFIHQKILEKEAGLKGVKDPGQIDSVLQHLQNDTYYPDFLDKITHLVFGLIKFHCFNDGNKRTALALGAYFIKLNFSANLAEKFLIEMENIVVEVAENKIDKELLKDIIWRIINETDDDEEWLYKLFKTLSK